MPGGEPGSRRERVGWYFYDWANSAFSTTVVTVFLGPYLTTVTRAAADPGGFVYPLGLPIHAGAYFPYLVSLSVFLQVLLLPLLGALADYSQRRKHLLALFAYVGVAATLGLALVEGDAYVAGGLLFVVANVAFGASVVVYNAFLPQIASPERRDAVSSTGWAMGYLGGGILLGLNLVFIAQSPALGLRTEQAVRVSLASAGVWWGLFTLIPIATLSSRTTEAVLPSGANFLTVGFRQLGTTLRNARGYRYTVLFLLAYLLYNDGVETVIALSAQFGQEELGLSVATLASVILMVQFVAFLGALLFGRLAGAIGAKRAIVISLLIWTGAVIYVYGFLQTSEQFYALGVVIALVLGGSQALSRSVYSLMIPRGQEAAYFGLYEISDRGTSWLGPLLYGLALQATGSFRLAILSVVIFFGLGLALLLRVDVRRGAEEAGNKTPARV